MSDSKRGTLITVGGPKSAKNKVTKTVRLTINLDESNESKYPELNYKELVIVQEKKPKVVQNGKTDGLDPFSDNDDDVERVAKKFEQKYGGKSTYGRKGKTKQDEFADIGAGYDENDSFIDNTDGYDEMIPPECDTLYGGFYINSGSLEFKTVPGDQLPTSDTEQPNQRRNKRRISSSSSEEESSDSSSASSHDEKEKPVANGAVDSLTTEHRKKKNKKNEKKKAKRIRRADSSAATSGKQTSDDNGHGDGESVDSRSSHSGSVTSKPAPSSENAVTSDSSRDFVDIKSDPAWPTLVRQAVDDLRSHVANRALSPGDALRDNDVKPLLIRIDGALSTCDTQTQMSVWTAAARLFNTTRSKLCQQVKMHVTGRAPPTPQVLPSAATTAPAAAERSLKRKEADIEADIKEIASMTLQEKEIRIQETLARLQALIEDKKPAMFASYNLECSRVQEERKKMQAASADGAPCIEKRLPKRRFPWCTGSRSLLAGLTRLAGSQADAATLLANRVLPLFPKGFVRMPTLLRQADLKSSDSKRQRVLSASQPPSAQNVLPTVASTFTEPIQFPSSLTVTTLKTSLDKETLQTGEDKESKNKSNNAVTKNLSSSAGGPFESQISILNSFVNNNKDVEKQEDQTNVKDPEKVKVDEKYVPPNSIGSITITPVNKIIKPDKTQSKTNPGVNNVASVHEKQKETFIRVKSPAALIREANEIAKKDKDSRQKSKHSEKSHSLPKEKRVASPLHIETNFQPKEKTPSPNFKKDEITHKQIENMRSAEDKIPRPALVPVHLSPTFAKPDKRPPDAKKKKEIVIVSDLDPLGDPLGDLNNEPVAIEDSDSDVEVIEDKSTESEMVKPKSDSNKPRSDLTSTKPKSEVNRPKETVPLKDKSVIKCANVQQDGDRALKERERPKDKSQERPIEKMDVDETDADADIDTVMRNLREMQDSQEPNYNSNSHGGVITSAKHVKTSSNSADALREPRTDKDKLAERNSLSKMDGCSTSQVDANPEPTTPTR